MINIRQSILTLLVIVACASALPSTGLGQGNFCQGCRTVVSFAEYFNKTESRNEMRELMRDFCETYYPPSTDFRGPCPWFVNGLYFVMDRTDPINHCDQIGACGVSSFDRQRNALSAFRPNQIQPVQNVDAQFCDVCQQLVIVVKGYLEDPKNIDEARQQLDSFCNYLDVVGIGNECKVAVSKYLNETIEFVMHIDPLNYCQSVQLCENKLVIAAKPKLISEPRQPKLPVLADFNKFGIETAVSIGDQRSSETSLNSKSLRGPGCALCKTVVKELFGFLKDNKTEANIINGLEYICSMVYSDKDKIQECDDMVNAYSRELIEFIGAETDAGMVCILIGQCAYYKEPTNLIEPPKPIVELKPVEVTSMQAEGLGQFMSRLDPTLAPGSYKTCIECKFFIRYLREKIEKPATVNEIKEYLLTHLCARLDDKDMQDTCKALVDNYSDIFFKAIVAELEPEAACVAMKACEPKDQEPFEAIIRSVLQSLDDEAATVAEKKPVNANQCQYCIQLADNLDSFIASYAGVPDPETLISAVCPKMFEDYEKMCTDMINSNGHSFIHHVSEMNEPHQVCSKLQYC